MMRYVPSAVGWSEMRALRLPPESSSLAISLLPESSTRRNDSKTCANILPLCPTAIYQHYVIGVKQVHRHPPVWAGTCDILPQGGLLLRTSGRL